MTNNKHRENDVINAAYITSAVIAQHSAAQLSFKSFFL